MDVFEKESGFHESYSTTEQAVIAALPLNVKYGLILAKAARIANIARPAEDLTSHYGLQEDIHVDDFITSYLLKTCLFSLLPPHRRHAKCNCKNDKFEPIYIFRKETIVCKWNEVDSDSACGWAIRIYERLKSCLERFRVETWHNDGWYLIECDCCWTERGCCKKRKLTLAMTSQILDWLKLHQQQSLGTNYWCLMASQHC